MSLPYEKATSGDKAYQDIQKILSSFGCDEFGMLTNSTEGYSLIHFRQRDRIVQLRASWKGYASVWLKKNPWNHRMKRSRDSHAELALLKGKVAAPSILRDWVKAQVTAIECGLMPFEEAFMPQMLLPDGSRLIEAVRNNYLLEAPKEL